MIAAIRKEIRLRQPELLSSPETVYFGGGTPSLLHPDELEAIVETVRETWGIRENAEITLECNPDDCTEENLRSWKQAGINRLSIGVQSLNDSQLGWMNRTHTVAEAKNAVDTAAGFGFDNFSVDLIYGLPGQSPADWEQTLREVMSWNINHLSAYCLTVEPKTSLEKWVSSGKLIPADNDLQARQFEILQKMSRALGFEQYEISNFARRENYSRHNTSYWKGKPYVGIGPSAHGFTGAERYWNIANNRLYMAGIEKGNLPETREKLSVTDSFNELLMIGLRTKWGVDKTQLFILKQPGHAWQGLVSSLQNRGELILTDTHMILTEQGRLRADAIASELFL